MSKPSMISLNLKESRKKFKSENVRPKNDYLFSMPSLESGKSVPTPCKRVIPKLSGFKRSPLKVNCIRKNRKMPISMALKKISSTAGDSCISPESIMSYILAPETESKHKKENRINSFLADSGIYKINLREALDELK